MKTADADILIVPGLGHSGPGHWQHRWVEKIRNAKFVEQEEWDAPTLAGWLETLEREIMMATRPVVLVGHSLGVLTIVARARPRPTARSKVPSSSHRPMSTSTRTFPSKPRPFAACPPIR